MWGSVSHKMTGNKFAAYPVPCLEFSCLLLLSTKIHYTVGTLFSISICHWQNPTFHSWRGKERDLMSKKDDFQMSPLLRFGKFFRVRQHESERKIRDKSPTVSRYELRSHTIPIFFSRRSLLGASNATDQRVLTGTTGANRCRGRHLHKVSRSNPWNRRIAYSYVSTDVLRN
jgi:hypothetical protein